MGRYPLGDPIPINIEAFDIWDDVLDEQEIREVAKQWKNGLAGGA